MVGSQDLKVELGRKHCAGDASGAVLPIPKQDVGMSCCLNECYEFGYDRGIGLTLDVFPCLQIDSSNQDGAFRGLPKKGLISLR